MKLLSFIALIVLASLAHAQQTTFILLRHAEKVQDGSKDPLLNEAGRARSLRLKEMLTDQEVMAIYSTPYQRTRQTVVPLAVEKSLEIQEYEPFSKGFLIGLLEEHSGATVVISGHSNTIPALVNELLGEEKYPQLSDDDYSNLFIVSLNKLGEAKEVVIQY